VYGRPNGATDDYNDDDSESDDSASDDSEYDAMNDDANTGYFRRWKC